MDMKTTIPTIDQGEAFGRFIKLLFPQYITDDSDTLRVWIYLLLRVTPIEIDPAHQPTPRGQFYITRSVVANELDMSEERVKDCLRKLEPYVQSQEVAEKNLCLITISHYDFYLQFFGSNED